MEDGQRTADTLVLTHPPYGLEPMLGNFSNGGGQDAEMQQFYASLRGLQTVRAKLDCTLINIVKGVAAHRRDGWSADELAHMKQSGLHSTAWEPGQDRDNRGKVYLYFCPEDMTVALSNVQGIGWQGVPDDLDGRHPAYAGPGAPAPNAPLVRRKPLQELGPSFLQRVFTRNPGTQAARRRLSRSASSPAVSPCASKASTTTGTYTPGHRAAHTSPRPANASSTANPCPSPTPPELYLRAPCHPIRTIRLASTRKRRPGRRRGRRQPRPGARHPRGAHPRPPPLQGSAVLPSRRRAAPRGA